MRAFDTNVVVRVLVRDDPVQCDLARQAFSSALAAGGAFISTVVLAELAWVLTASFKLARPSVTVLLRQLVSFEGVIVEDDALVREALAAYGAGVADFSDYLIRESARSSAALPLVTFDARLSREGDVELLRQA